MARVPTLTREQVPENDREAFDHETSGSGGVVESGPGSAMINNPEMRRRANQLAFYLRQESVLPKKLQELAMILTARSMD
jgi:4-carboxymuconolactone decarboxylase